MKDLHSEYHPRTIGETLVQAAEHEDYAMVGLCSILLVISPITYPVMFGMTLYGMAMSKFINWVLG